MPKILIYTTRYCPYCHRAKRLLTQKGASFEEIDVSGDWAARDALAEKAGGLTTVPQIWIGDTHVGGSDELARPRPRRQARRAAGRLIATGALPLRACLFESAFVGVRGVVPLRGRGREAMTHGHALKFAAATTRAGVTVSHLAELVAAPPKSCKAPSSAASGHLSPQGAKGHPRAHRRHGFAMRVTPPM